MNTSSKIALIASSRARRRISLAEVVATATAEDAGFAPGVSTSAATVGLADGHRAAALDVARGLDEALGDGAEGTLGLARVA